MALLPRRSWRSWNQYGWYITEDVILAAAKGLADTSQPIKGMPKGTSLKDLGYSSVGMDEVRRVAHRSACLNLACGSALVGGWVEDSSVISKR